MPWDIELTEKAALVSMNSNPVGVMNEGFFEDLRSAFSSLAEKHPSKPVVLASAAKTFSSGLDLDECVPLFRRGDKKEIDVWFERFFSSMVAVLEHPAPVIAAIGGHAIAGGCLLALCCDIRIAEEGKPRIGLNEETIGFPMPISLAALVTGALGTRRGKRIMKRGEIYNALDARELGIINRICLSGEAARTALAEAERLLNSDSGGKKAKAHITGKVRKLFNKEDRYRLAGRLSAPETIERLEALIQTLKKAKKGAKTIKEEETKAKKAAKPEEEGKKKKAAKTKKEVEVVKVRRRVRAKKTTEEAKEKKAETKKKTTKAPAKAKKG
ncbi:MAG: enoyl-CoA hydratase/isomerase family protein [Candidatus Dadabacteria bacterium]|nr:enoyl-CoA hydratase/isomerase family protein [Candidatus Dadabacteria bacterium]